MRRLKTVSALVSADYNNNYNLLILRPAELVTLSSRVCARVCVCVYRSVCVFSKMSKGVSWSFLMNWNISIEQQTGRQTEAKAKTYEHTALAVYMYLFDQVNYDIIAICIINHGSKITTHKQSTLCASI